MTEHTVLDTGPFKVEIRRYENGDMEFRPIPEPDSSHTAARYMNLEFGLQGGAWAVVPRDLEDEANKAFEVVSTSMDID
jgi:hypothetical protein